MRLILSAAFTAFYALAPASESGLRILLHDPFLGHGDARSHLNGALHDLAASEFEVHAGALSQENLDASDVVVLSGALPETLAETEREILTLFVRQGGGVVSVHPAAPGETHFARSKAIVSVDASATADPLMSAIFEGLPPETVLNERWLLGRASPMPNDMVVLRAGTARHGAATLGERPVVWVRPEGEGRMVTSLLGKEDIYSQADGYGRTLLRNAVRYASGRADGTAGKVAALADARNPQVRLFATSAGFSLSLASAGNHMVQVRDSRGRVLLARSLQGPTEFQSPGQRGVLHVRVDGPDGTVTRRLVLP